jgi:uncharacterized protein (TIGR02145 family)
VAASSPTWDAAEFGRLLTHEEALRLAPTGFHLPTADEWQELNAQISGSLDSRRLLLREFRLLLHDHHGSFWTATITTSGTHALVADTSTYSWDEGNYWFVLQAKSRDLFRYPARYVKD